MQELDFYKKLIKQQTEEYTDNIEGLLQLLRANGASQMTCVRILMSVYGYSLGEADKIVLNSKTWKDGYEITMYIRKGFVKEDEEE